MAKNAYEIRLDILSMVHADANMRYLEKLNFHRDQNGRVTDVRIIEDLYPKPEEIIKRAIELYKFVEDNGL